MDRRQHSEQWNQMLEDALNSILNPTNATNPATNPVTTDISNNNNTSSTENVENTVETTSTTTPTTTTPTTTTPAPRTTLAQINTNAFATTSPNLLNNHIRPSMTNSSSSTVDSTTSLYNDDELINKFTGQWFDCMYRYHMNVRQYHQNINQFNRLSSNIYNDLANQRRTRRINSLMESIHRNHSSPVLNIPIPPLNIPNVGGTDSSTTSTSTSTSTTLPGTIPFSLNNPSTVPLFTNNTFPSMPISLQELLARSPPGQQIEIQGFTIPVMDGYEPDSTERFPTIAQIFEATEVFTYNDDSSSRVTDTRCPITLDDFEYGEELCEIKHCHHVFKWSSLRTWFSQNTHCPVCRHDIIEVDTRA